MRVRLSWHRAGLFPDGWRLPAPDCPEDAGVTFDESEPDSDSDGEGEDGLFRQRRQDSFPLLELWARGVDGGAEPEQERIVDPNAPVVGLPFVLEMETATSPGPCREKESRVKESRVGHWMTAHSTKDCRIFMARC